MGVSGRALPSLLLAVLLTSLPGARGANPGLVVRITDKGLAYGKKRWLSAGLVTRLAPGCSGYGGAQIGCPSVGRVAFRASRPRLGLWPHHPTAVSLRHVLS